MRSESSRVPQRPIAYCLLPFLMKKHIAILAILAFIVYLLPALIPGIGRAILDDADAFYTHTAHQMVVRNDWVTPYANGIRFLDKPPLVYWMIAGSYKIFGVNDFATRFPTALFIFLAAVLLYKFGEKAAGRYCGLLSGIIFILSIGTLFFTLETLPDIYLVFSIAFSLYCFQIWYLKSQQGQHDLFSVLGFFAGLGGAVLAKSTIGAVFPCAIVVSFLIVSKSLPRVKITHFLLGVLFFLAIILPWHILAGLYNQGFWQQYFINEQVMRFLGRRYPVDYVSVPRLIFWALLIGWLFPWSFFFPAAWYQVKNLWRDKTATGVIVKLAVCWVGVILLFFTASARLEHYIFPALPAFALLLGITISKFVTSPLNANVQIKTQPGQHVWMNRALNAFGIIGIIFTALAVIVSILFAIYGNKIIPGSESTQHNKGYTNLFSPVLDLPLALREQLVPLLISALTIFGLGLLFAWLSNRRNRQSYAVVALSVMVIGFGYLTLRSLHLCEELVSSKEFAVKLKELYQPGDQIVVIGDYETANSINYYTPLPLRLYDGMSSSLDHGMRYPDAPKMIVSQIDLDNMWKSNNRIFLLAYPDRIKKLGYMNPPIIMNYGGRTLICNQNYINSPKILD